MIQITLRNWQSHSDTTIKFDGEIGFVVGQNGVGKTAIRDALEFAYVGTGLLRKIQTKSLLGQLSIRDGAKDCEVIVETPARRIRRVMKPSGAQKVFLKEGDFDEEQIVIGQADEKLHGMAPDAVRMLLEPTAWFDLSGERRTELLVNATRSDAGDVEDILSVMKRFLEPDSPEDLGAIEGIAATIAEKGFREGEAKAVEKRKLAKRALAEFRTVEPDPMFESIDLSKHTIEGHEARLKELREQKQALVLAAATDVAGIKGQADEAYQKLQGLLNATLEQPDAEAPQRAAEIGQEIDKAKLALSGLLADRDIKQIVLDGTIRRSEVEVVEHPGQCPHLRSMKCGVKLTTFQKAAEAATLATEEDVAEARGAVLEMQDKVDNATEALEALEIRLVTARTDAVTAKEQAAAITAHLGLIEAAEARVAELDTELREAEVAADAPAEDGAMTIEQLGEKIELGERVVHAKRMYDQAVVAHAGEKSERVKTQADLDRWNAIAVELKPGGAIERAAGDGAAEPFLQALNEFAPLSGQVTIEPDFELRVGPEKRHIAQLSTSQQLALGIAIQHAFCQVLQFPILVCDALDLFKGKPRKAWLQCVLNVRDQYAGGVIGLATSELEKMQAPPSGCITFHLRPSPAGVSVETVGREA